MGEKRSLIIDCDPGIDDFFALLFAFGSKKLEVLALTAVAGNTTLKNTARNALDIVHFCGKDIPVFAGAEKPLQKESLNATYMHGFDGLGDIKFPSSQVSLETEHAWDAIIRLSHQNKNLTVIAIGPLTNMAIALAKDPDLENRLGQILIMGGSAVGGNITRAAEFNFYADPLAAEMVLQAKVKKIIFPLDVTMSRGFTTEDVTRLLSSIEYKKKIIALQLFEHLCQNCRQFGYEKAYLHDLFPVIFACQQDFFHGIKTAVHVDLYGRLAEGRSVVDFDHVLQEEQANALYITRIDHSVFDEFLFDCNIID